MSPNGAKPPAGAFRCALRIGEVAPHHAVRSEDRSPVVAGDAAQLDEQEVIARHGGHGLAAVRGIAGIGEQGEPVEFWELSGSGRLKLSEPRMRGE